MWVHAPRCSATRRAPAVWQGSSCCLQGTRASRPRAEHLLPTGATLPVREAQDATRMLVDPATGRQLWPDEAVRAGLFGPELHRQLLAAEQVVTGYRGPFSGIRMPLFQAMTKELVDRPPLLRLLVAQLATGRRVCPARRLRLPLEATLHFGCLDKELSSISRRRLASRTPACRRASAVGSCWPTVSPTQRRGWPSCPSQWGVLERSHRGPRSLSTAPGRP
ncbi:epiplakin-like [Orcinus orca]|uniref:epiplakin-like n=1 Tax=Orcinus orca TaxID=9733 RepID=UPI002111328D|nr:epiplakin-like [Orcinus orca]